jgi:tRNA A-37 threonylcarbamoyl transferase component Bud32
VGERHTDREQALLSRNEIEAHVHQVLEPGTGRDPVVSLACLGGQKVVIKDFASRGFWVRNLIGRWMIAREAKAYRALAGHPAVPRFYGCVDALALALEYRPGRRMSRSTYATLPPGFLGELEEAIREMHVRGVAHLDLRHRTNIMADAKGHPVLIDFGAAVCLRPGSFAARVLLPLLAQFDWRALRKWQLRMKA